jgi:serine/threonine protein phosphatase PrpC
VVIMIEGIRKFAQNLTGRRSVVWRTEHLSLRGDKHVRDDSPGQDASDSRSFDDGRWAYVVVADGHGSVRHFRSADGSALAVATMRDVFHSFRDLVRGLDGPSPDELVQAWDLKAREIVPRWRAKIHSHLVAHPARTPGKTDGERGLVRYLDDFAKRNGYAQLERLFWQLRNFDEYAEDALSKDAGALGPLPYFTDPRWDQVKYGGWQAKAYGTTLLGVLVGPETLHWVQVGDGAMVQIVGGEASYLVSPPPEALGNATPSLCDEDAHEKIRYGTTMIHSGHMPSGIVLTTDGVPNSFDDNTGFLSFCSETAHRADTSSSFQADLPRWLQEISRRGSGDDTSVALAWLRELPTPEKPAPATEETQPDAVQETAVLPKVSKPKPDVQPDPEPEKTPSHEERLDAKSAALAKSSVKKSTWVVNDPPNALDTPPTPTKDPQNEEEVTPSAEHG